MPNRALGARVSEPDRAPDRAEHRCSKALARRNGGQNSTLLHQASRWATLAWSVAIWIVGTWAAAAQPVTTLSGQLELARVVDLAAERLGVNVEYDGSKLKGVVTLRLTGGITDGELWQLTNRLLLSRGFTTVRRAGEDTISVVPITEAPEAARVELHEALSDERAPAGFRTELVHIEHGNTQTIVDALQALIGRNGKLTRLGQSNQLMVSAPTEQMDLVHRLLENLDAADLATTVEEFRVEHVSIDRLMALAEQMQASRELVSGRPLPGKLLRAPDGDTVLVVAPESQLAAWEALIDQLDRLEPAFTRSYIPRQFGITEVQSLIDATIAPTGGSAEGRWRVVADSLTASLIITATQAQHDQIAELIDRLSETPAAERRPMRSWAMQNRPVDEVLSVLEGLQSAGALSARMEGLMSAGEGRGATRPASGREGRSVQSQPGDSTSRGAALSSGVSELAGGMPGHAGAEELTLTADRGTNTLIAVGSPRLLEQIDALLAAIDVRQPQVMIEVLMIGLTDAQTKDLAIHLDQIVTKGGTLMRLSSLFGLSDFAGDTDTAGFSGAGGTAVILDPGDFGVLVRALETLNHGRTLSMPRVLATNNVAATFNSTVNEPYLSTNASDTVATTSFGGSESAGTQISITPQIAAGDHLLLEYNVTLSAFVGESASPSLPPARQQNVISSTATIPDGYTVAVGGFEFTATGDSVNQVPLVSKIPLLGELFKSRSRSTSRTRFYVFIRANVLRSAGFDDLKYISDRWAGEADLDTEWPKVEPQVIR